MSRSEVAQRILFVVAGVLRGLKGQLKSQSDDGLIELDRLLQELLGYFKWVVADAAAEDPVLHVSDSNRVVRIIVTYFSLHKIVTAVVKTSTGSCWGAHVVSPNDFEQIAFDDFDVPRSVTARARLLEDQSADLIEATSDLGELVPGPVSIAYIAAIRRVVEDLCHHFGTRVGQPLSASEYPFELYAKERACSELGISETELENRRKTRAVLSVPTWLGDIRYPGFQFSRGDVKPVIKHIISNVDRRLSDWPLTIFMFTHRDEHENFFVKVLQDRGLWRPAWTQQPTREFKGLAAKNFGTRRSRLTLYRVANERYSPFYFSSCVSVRDAGSLGAPLTEVGAPLETDVGGRFDLDHETGRGTVYLAESPSGAWAEVLDREPVVTLRSLLGRYEWTLVRKNGISLGDVTERGAQIATANRADTQALAGRISADGHEGVRYILRARGNEIGVALFGTAGANLPGSVGLGAWSSRRKPGIEAKGLWDYLSDREKRDVSYPVLLRRFPDEIAVARFGVSLGAERADEPEVDKPARPIRKRVGLGPRRARVTMRRSRHRR